MTFLPLLALLMDPVCAQGCNAVALQKKLEEASARETVDIFQELLTCDVEAAAAVAPAVFSRILPGDEGEAVAIVAMEAGLGDAVRGWISNLLSDERAATLVHLGEQCTENPAVVSFLVESREVMGDRFWDDRWHRSLAGCKSEETQKVLREALQSADVERYTMRFNSILEVFCRSSRHDAIPWLKALLYTSSGENQVAVMSAFADAAGVGSLEGTDPEAVADAVEAILQTAPSLPLNVVEQARITLQSLQAEDAADSLARVRYADRWMEDSYLLWGTVAVETATCKNGKTRLGVHFGQMHEAGHRWPDQIRQPLEQAVQASWKMNLGERCKGSSVYDFAIPDEPFADQAAWEAWYGAEVKDAQRRQSDWDYTYDEEEPVILP